MPLDLTAVLRNHAANSLRGWRQDLAATDPARLTERPSPTARSVADIAYETGLVNLRGAKRMRGEDPGPGVGFPACPSELANADALTDLLSRSLSEVLDAAADPERRVAYPGGEESAFEYALGMLWHMDYHLGQINYIQTLHGDTEVHWGE